MSNNIIFRRKSIQVIQHAPNSFTVKYGKQVDSRVDYRTAARHLGESIMHSLACQGLIREEA